MTERVEQIAEGQTPHQYDSRTRAAAPGLELAQDLFSEII